MKEDGGQQNSEKSGAVPKVVDTARPKTQVNSSMVWIIGDTRSTRKKQFEKAGMTIGNCGHPLKSQRPNWKLRLSTDQPRLLYILSFGGMDETEEVSNFISAIVTDQLNLRGYIVLEAPEISSVWTMPHGKITESTEWTPAVTRWCSFHAEHQAAKGERSDKRSKVVWASKRKEDAEDDEETAKRRQTPNQVFSGSLGRFLLFVKL